MAEIRKFDPAAGNAIAQALRAAMGEQVRPTEPGSRPVAATPQPEAPVTTSWLSVNVSRPVEDEPEED